jgi:hypothetical protein
MNYFTTLLGLPSQSTYNTLKQKHRSQHPNAIAVPRYQTCTPSRVSIVRVNLLSACSYAHNMNSLQHENNTSKSLWRLADLLGLLIAMVTRTLILGSISAEIVLAILVVFQWAKKGAAWLFRTAEWAEILLIISDRDDGKHEAVTKL